MKKIDKYRLLYILILAILPANVVVSRNFYYVLLIFLFCNDLLVYSFNLKVKKNIILMILFSGISINGIINAELFSFNNYLSSFINYSIILLILNNTLSWIKTSEKKIILKNIKYMNYLMSIICFLGILQFFGILNIASRSYVTYSGGIENNLIRMTSIFNEPSALAYFLCSMYFINTRYVKRWKYALLYFLCIVGTISLTAYLLFFLIEIINMRKKNIFKTLFSFLIINGALYFLSSKYQIVINLVYLRIIQGGFGSYRILAPIRAIQLMIEHPLKFFLGSGLNSLSVSSKLFNLPETAATTHNYFVDILFEIGCFGLFLNIYFLYKKLKINKLRLTLLMFLLVGTGYRSGRFLFITIIFMLGAYFFNEDSIRLFNNHKPTSIL